MNDDSILQRHDTTAVQRRTVMDRDPAAHDVPANISPDVSPAADHHRRPPHANDRFRIERHDPSLPGSAYGRAWGWSPASDRQH
jgi:hypothetical protein